MDTGRPPFEPILDANGALDADLACVHCGYNVRGLPPDCICPECATPIGRSLRGDLLQFSDPDWVQRMAQGATLIVVALVLTFGLIVAGQVAIFSFRIRLSAAPVMKSLNSYGLPLISLVGYWLVTSPEPRRSHSEHPASARAIVRITAVMAVVLGVGHELLEYVEPSLVHYATLIVGLNGLIATVASFTYARQLALRIPDRRLAKHTRIVMWGTIAVLSLLLLLAAAAWVGASAPPIGARIPGSRPAAAATTRLLFIIPIVAASGCLAAPLALVFGIWALILILRYRKALSMAASAARANSSRDTV